MANRHLKTLECLCVKAATGTLTATGITVKAKLSCNVALKENIVTSKCGRESRAGMHCTGLLFSPHKFCQSVEFTDVDGTGPIYTVTLESPVSCHISDGDEATIEKSGQTYKYYVLSTDSNKVVLLYKLGQEAPDTPISSLCSGGYDNICLIKFCNSGEQTNPRLTRARVCPTSIAASVHISSKLSGRIRLGENSLSAVGKINNGLTTE